MGEEAVQASADSLHQISTSCQTFSDEVTDMLKGFSDEITYLLGGALRTPKIQSKLHEVQGQIDACTRKLQNTMVSVSEDFQKAKDLYVETNETSAALVTHLYDYTGLK
jgi:hypothetical protein